MTDERSLKRFYIGLGLIAAAGASALFVAWLVGGGVQAETVDPLAFDPEFDAAQVLGHPDAPITVIQYADFECPACTQFALMTFPRVRAELIETGRVRWVFRDFPLPAHENAMPASLFATCAGEQGKFWPLHDYLFRSQPDWVQAKDPTPLLRLYVERLGLDVARCANCVRSGRPQERLETLRRQALALGVDATPTFFIGDQRVSGPLSYEQLMVLVRRAEQGASR